MKPINIIKRLNEAAIDDSFDRFTKDLETGLRDAGYKVETKFGGSNYENEDGMAYITVSYGEYEQQIDLYKGGNNISDFEEDTIGIGGDTVGKTVLPSVRDGWDWDDANPSSVGKLKTGDEVYVIFKPIKETSVKEVVEIVDDSFKKVINKNELSEANTDGKSKYCYIKGANEYDEVYNSEANTDVQLILDELKRYFDEAYTCAEGIIKNANHDPGVYKSDLELLKFSSEKVQELIDKWNSAWE